MTKKELVLDSIVNGGDYGECEAQIKEYFKLVEVDFNDEEITNIIKELLDEGLIYVSETWENEYGEKPYVVTSQVK